MENKEVKTEQTTIQKKTKIKLLFKVIKKTFQGSGEAAHFTELTTIQNYHCCAVYLCEHSHYHHKPTMCNIQIKDVVENWTISTSNTD